MVGSRFETSLSLPCWYGTYVWWFITTISTSVSNLRASFDASRYAVRVLSVTSLLDMARVVVVHLHKMHEFFKFSSQRTQACQNRLKFFSLRHREWFDSTLFLSDRVCGSNPHKAHTSFSSLSSPFQTHQLGAHLYPLRSSSCSRVRFESSRRFLSSSQSSNVECDSILHSTVLSLLLFPVACVVRFHRSQNLFSLCRMWRGAESMLHCVLLWLDSINQNFNAFSNRLAQNVVRAHVLQIFIQILKMLSFLDK